MDWFIGIAIAVAGWFALEIAGDIAGEWLRPILNRLYSPPHGGALLACTWLAAGALVGLALVKSEWSEGWRSAVTIIPVGVALFASFIYRDERRRTLGLPEIVTVVPDRFSWRARIGLALLGCLALLMAYFSFIMNGWPAWLEALGFLAFALATGYVAITGRMPDMLIASIGARKKADGRLP